jgi:hypothetical protein
MRLKYHILWFEDDGLFVSELRPSIEGHLADLGFEAVLYVKDDDKDVLDLMKKEDIDLLLVDYVLKDGRKGDELIETVRRNELLTDAVFYSQVSKYLEQAKGQLEGVFYASRDGLENKALRIIDLTVKKSQDFCTVRGLFIAEAIDMVGQMEEIVSRILKIEGKQYEFFKEKVIQEEFFTDYQKYRIIQSFFNQEIGDLEARYQKSSGGEREEIVPVLSEMKTLKSELNQFETDVINIRNELAHGKPVEDKRNVLIWRGKERVYDETWCKEVRGKFLRHSKNLKSAIEFLESQS